MKSKTSFFNKTLFKKNLTRFAPVWGLYTVCLIVGLAMTYTNRSGEQRLFWFAANLAQDVPQIMGIVNLFYAPLVAQLLFGDLYNSRMCNALHALPLRREEYYVTNLLSGLAFSFGPTLVMSLLSLPLLMNSIFVNAWQIAFLVLVIVNLQFICFFGIAAFCSMVVGNRFTMVAGYGLINAGAYIAYWMVDTLYTPMLYGVITPARLAEILTPIGHMVDKYFIDCTPYNELYAIMDKTKVAFSALTAEFTLTENWGSLFICAASGIAFMVAGLVLYRIRHLECAGDAVAFPVLVPVFQVLCSLFVMVAVQFFLTSFFGIRLAKASQYLVLAVGLVVGWITGKMLVERSTRVFRLKNFYGLGILALVLALSLVGTHFDVLGIETRLPRADKIKSVNLGSGYGGDCELTSEEAVADVLRIHELALNNRPEGGTELYVRGYDGSFVQVIDTNDGLYDSSVENPEFTYVTSVYLTYTLENGSKVRRTYYLWTESEEGGLLREHLSHWETVNELRTGEDGKEVPVMDIIMADFDHMRVDVTTANEVSPKLSDQEDALSFLEALKADCEAGTMAQDSNFHKDCFREKTPRVVGGAEYYDKSTYIGVNLRSERYGWYIKVHADCENSLRWLRDRGFLDNVEILENTCPYWTAVKEQPATEG